jgi:hypothetical protein
MPCPGSGIVAAVLGIVITMGSIAGPIEEIGHHVAAALVGTFIGILISYGFLIPRLRHHWRPNGTGAEITLPAVAFAASVVGFAKCMAPGPCRSKVARRAITSGRQNQRG